MADRWQDDAACKGKTKRMYLLAFEKLARETCAGCPVRVECQLEGRDEEFGIWGGLTPGERRAVVSARRRRVA